MPRSISLAERLHEAWRIAARTARLAVGVPDYDAYLAHMRVRHVDTVPMTRREFFANRVQARYAKGSSRCC